MPLPADLAGRTFPPTPPYEVAREKIREFTTAIGASVEEPDGGEVAPPTFPIVVAFRAMQALLAEPDVGVALHRVVHGDQRFVYTRPVHAGDVLIARLTLESLRQAAGADIIGTRTDIATADGDHVVSAYATLVHRAEEPAS
ncbi:MAG: MaoC family dehydratase N-terminal domain-containing protein [Actinomycetota bacterium]|nr:MaoC family dehydratase N-terminal domain-containing protein [Actinomycetota bacterium]